MAAPHSLLARRLRLRVPGWLIAALVGAAIASGVTAWLDDSGATGSAPAASEAPAAGDSLLNTPTTCIDPERRIAGLWHC
jgi:hypothetical protein